MEGQTNHVGLFHRIYGKSTFVPDIDAETYNHMTSKDSSSKKVVEHDRFEIPMSEYERDPDNFRIGDYITFNYDNDGKVGERSDYLLKMDCFYLIKFDHIFGTLYVKEDSIEFEPGHDKPENQKLNLKYGDINELSSLTLKDYAFQIDFLDVL